MIDLPNTIVLDNYPTAVEFTQIEEIRTADKPFKSTLNKLQESNIEFKTVRVLFNKLIQLYPPCINRLGANAEIVQSPHFESAICKVTY